MKGVPQDKLTKSRKGERALSAAKLDPRTVLATTNGFGADLKLQAEEIVFSQGDEADAVFLRKSTGSGCGRMASSCRAPAMEIEANTVCVKVAENVEETGQ